MVLRWLMVLGLCIWCGTAMGAILSQDFVHGDANPSGVWSYGYAGNDGTGSWVPYDSHTQGDAYLWNWCKSGDPDTHGNVNKAFGSATDHPEWGPGMSWEADMVCVMTPTSSGEVTVVAFTTPQAGQWSVAVNFDNRVMNGAATNVFVKVNDTMLLSDTIDGFAGSSLGAPAVAPSVTDGSTSMYTGILNLNPGDVIAFGVYGDGLHQVAVDADIHMVPEPATMGLLVLGSLLLRRRS